MDAAFLDHYNHELGFLRQLGAEFADEYPGVAGRLGLDGFHCQDPYVERLLEGFAFLAARVHRRIDAEFPEFTGGLLDSIYPQLTRPIPSAAIITFVPDPNEGSLAAGYRLPRGTRLRSPVSDRSPTPVQMVTTRDTDLNPLRIADARWIDRQSSTDVLLADSALNRSVVRSSTRSLLHVRLETLGGIAVSDLAIDRLMLHWRGGEIAVRLLEKLHTRATDIAIRSGDLGTWQRIDADNIQAVGFGEDEWLMPPDSRTFRGYQWLQEYFLLPEKFLFTELIGLNTALRESASSESAVPDNGASNGANDGTSEGATPTQLDIVIAFDDVDPLLADAFGPEHVALHCVPVVNLFSKRADRMQLDERVYEQPLIVDRSRPMDFEVWSIQDCHGHGVSSPDGLEYRPLYSPPSRSGVPRSHDRFYTMRRRPRQQSERQQDFGHRSSYMGSEAWVTLTQSGQTAGESTATSALTQLSATVMCTNRDLILCPPKGGWTNAFSLEGPGPVLATRVLSGPTPPRAALATEDDQRCWRLIQHLQMEALPLSDSEPFAEEPQVATDAAQILKDRLALYCPDDVPLWKRQLDGIVALHTKPSTRQLPLTGRIVYGRGVDIDLHFDESAFESSGLFLLASILERFFSLDTSLNTFVCMTAHSTTRGKIHTWPLRMGGTPAL